MNKIIVLLLLAACLPILSGCTTVEYFEVPAPTVENPEPEPSRHLVIRDLRITGSAIDLQAVINNVGTLTVNREQGSTDGVISEVGDIVNPLSFP